MATRVGIGIGYMIADAEHVYGASLKHWAELIKHGPNETDKKGFRAAIDHAKKLADDVGEETAGSLEEARTELKDLLRFYRTAADLYSNGRRGLNAPLQRELRADGPFPVTDTRIKAYVTGLAKVMKKHAGKLADNGFKKEDQARLSDLTVLYVRLVNLRGRERGEVRSLRATRDAALEALHQETSYFRRVGRAALYDSAQRADFDRLRRSPRAKKASPPTPLASPTLQTKAS